MLSVDQRDALERILVDLNKVQATMYVKGVVTTSSPRWPIPKAAWETHATPSAMALGRYVP